MKEKTICVFCGREEEQGILSGGHFVSCGGTYQPVRNVRKSCAVQIL